MIETGDSQGSQRDSPVKANGPGGRYVGKRSVRGGEALDEVRGDDCASRGRPRECSEVCK
jgi:hypothetical protein